MKKYVSCLAVVAALIASSCNKYADKQANPNPTPVTGDSSIAPISFNFSTTKTVSVNVKLATNSDEAIAGVPVHFYSGDPATTSPIFTAISDANGAVTGSVAVPQYVDTLIIDPQYVGLMRYAKTLISNDMVTATIGGSNNGTNILESSYRVADSKFKSLGLSSNITGSTVYSYMGTYDNNGVPNYLEPQRDVISAKLLSYVNSSLPETKNVAITHPEYLKSGNALDLNINATADVWITFVSEGAGYLNSVGYYTYPTGSIPQKTSDIDSIHYMFPNASLPNSGGNLQAGSKVKLGRFNAGTSIGFILLSNAWNGTSHTVNNNAMKLFTDANLNPETDPSLQQHTVLLSYPQENKFLIGFEDQNRQNPGCDHDFNDVVFYATSNPISAISTTNVQVVDSTKDSDHDGVSDQFDQYPSDPARAFNNYYPSQTTFGTLAYEDLWPGTGDYDMNDLVVNYRYKYVTNGSGNVVELFGNYYVRAAGATFQNGFGVQFPFSASAIKQVTGQRFVSNYITQSANGTEAGQSKAVIIPFDNYQALATKPNGFLINTQKAGPVVSSDTAKVYVSFTTPLSPATFGTAPFNPFLISNLRRSYEVHLPGNAQTDLANIKLFGTQQDYTHPTQGYYYKSKNAWPWALSFVEQFDYPVEGTSINKAYNYFLVWAQSGGTQYKDWYKNTSGYRNTSSIYHK